ncbi:hypothetical protein D3C84_1098250 [compost metagenome]
MFSVVTAITGRRGAGAAAGACDLSAQLIKNTAIKLKRVIFFMIGISFNLVLNIVVVFEINVSEFMLFLFKS